MYEYNITNKSCTCMSTQSTPYLATIDMVACQTTSKPCAVLAILSKPEGCLF